MGNTTAISFLFIVFIFIVMIYNNDYRRIKKQIKELEDDHEKTKESITKIVEVTTTSYNNIEIILNNHANNLDILHDKVEDLEDVIKDGDVGVFFESDFDETPPKKGQMN